MKIDATSFALGLTTFTLKWVFAMIIAAFLVSFGRACHLKWDPPVNYLDERCVIGLGCFGPIAR